MVRHIAKPKLLYLALNLEIPGTNCYALLSLGEMTPDRHAPSGQFCHSSVAFSRSRAIGGPAAPSARSAYRQDRHDIVGIRGPNPEVVGIQCGQTRVNRAQSRPQPLQRPIRRIQPTASGRRRRRLPRRRRLRSRSPASASTRAPASAPASALASSSGVGFGPEAGLPSECAATPAMRGAYALAVRYAPERGTLDALDTVEGTI